MNWYKQIKTSQANIQSHPNYQLANSFPVINSFGNMTIRPIGDSMSSIDSSFTKWESLPGFRNVPFSVFGNISSSAKNQGEKDYLSSLGNDIQQSQSIEPLIIVFDGESSPWVLEGAHRFDALVEMGFKSMPAMIVLDFSSIQTEPSFYDSKERPETDAFLEQQRSNNYQI